MPARRDRPIQLPLPPVETVQQIALAMGKVATAVGEGEITPAEGEVVANILVAQRDIVTTASLERCVLGLGRCGLRLRGCALILSRGTSASSTRDAGSPAAWA